MDVERVCRRIALIGDWWIVDEIRSLLSSGLCSVSVTSVGIVDSFPYFSVIVCWLFERTTVDHRCSKLTLN